MLNSSKHHARLFHRSGRRSGRGLLLLGGLVPLALSLALALSMLEGATDIGSMPPLRALLLESARVCSLAVTLALPPALLAAIHTNEFASQGNQRLLRSSFELLAGLPSVVFAFVGLELLVPALGLGPGQAVLAAGLTLAMMLAPSLALGSATVLSGIPVSLREGAWALGAGRAQTVLRIVLPSAVPGLIAVVLLALARALGELVIVALVLGPSLAHQTLAAFIAHTPREAVGAGGPGLFWAAAVLVLCTSLLGSGARRLLTIQRDRGGLP